MATYRTGVCKNDVQPKTFGQRLKTAAKWLGIGASVAAVGAGSFIAYQQLKK